MAGGRVALPGGPAAAGREAILYDLGGARLARTRVGRDGLDLRALGLRDGLYLVELR
jgi:hypothetical protein